MIHHITEPSVVEAAGTQPQLIQEFVGRVNTGSDPVSIARMNSPTGWAEPGQTPEFDEYTLVLKGSLTVETREKTYEVKAGELIYVSQGQWVRYSSPSAEGAEYISFCIPAFSPDTVHRDE
jgi:mannose-6-phosphate isomerase-like protein (cupin superfamily)